MIEVELPFPDNQHVTTSQAVGPWRRNQQEAAEDIAVVADSAGSRAKIGIEDFLSGQGRAVHNIITSWFAVLFCVSEGNANRSQQLRI